MNVANKLLQSMRSNLRDWQIEQLYTVARQHNVEVRSRGGSHHVFSHRLVAELVSVPAHRPIKPVYIRQFIALCEQAHKAEEEEQRRKESKR